MDDLVGIRDAQKKKKVDASTDNLNPENAFDGKITPEANFMLTNWLMRFVWKAAFWKSLAMLVNFVIVYIFVSPYEAHYTGEFLRLSILNSTLPDEVIALEIYDSEQRVEGFNVSRIFQSEAKGNVDISCV